MFHVPTRMRTTSYGRAGGALGAASAPAPSLPDALASSILTCTDCSGSTTRPLPLPELLSRSEGETSIGGGAAGCGGAAAVAGSAPTTDSSWPGGSDPMGGGVSPRTVSRRSRSESMWVTGGLCSLGAGSVLLRWRPTGSTAPPERESGEVARSALVWRRSTEARPGAFITSPSVAGSICSEARARSSRGSGERVSAAPSSAKSTAASKMGREASACTSWQKRSASRCSANCSSHRRTLSGPQQTRRSAVSCTSEVIEPSPSETSASSFTACTREM